MIQTIEQSLDVYKNELRRYVEAKKQLKVKYGNGLDSKWSSVEITVALDRMGDWWNRLAGMEIALGLTEEEIAKIHEECGVDTVAA